MKRHVLLIDINNYIHRFYHALSKQLTSPAGQLINAVYGICRLLTTLILEHQNTNTTVAVIFDHGPSFRKDIDPKYKINRAKMPDDLLAQQQIIKQAVIKFGLQVISKPRYEADDLIASYAKQAQNLNIPVTIISNDKDLLQLVNHNNSMYDPSKKKTYTPPDVYLKMQVHPHQIKDLLALTGDATDNIIGIPGVGPKTAAKLLNTYDNIDNLLQCLQELPTKLRHKIEDCVQDLERNRQLTALKNDIDLDIPIEKLPRLTLNKSQDLFNFCQSYGFISIIKKLQLTADNNVSVSRISNLSQISPEQILTVIMKNGWCSVAYRHHKNPETNIHYQLSHVLIYTDNVYCTWHLTLDHDTRLNTNKAREFCNILQKIVQQNIKIFCYHSKNLSAQLTPRAHTKAEIHDVAIMYQLTNTNQYKTIKSLHDVLCIVTQSHNCYDDALHINQQLLIEAQSIKTIYDILYPKIQDMQLSYIYQKLEIPIIKVILAMEITGVKIDTKVLDNLTQVWQKKIQYLEQKIYHFTGKQFNIGSPKQLAKILYDVLALPTQKKRSTDNNSLLYLLEQGYTIAHDIIEWRKYNKLKTAYTHKLPLMINANTNRIHSNYDALGTSTGRLSSYSPNLQNIPVRSTEGEEIRSAFIAASHYKILKIDYSQIELRILAYMANISSMLQVFNDEQDIHILTACELFNTKAQLVTTAMRNTAKTINFGIIYGMTPFGLTQKLRINHNQAKKYIDHYLNQYPGIKKYTQQNIEQARQCGYVTTLHHRRCYIPNIKSPVPSIRTNAERLANNAPIQGTAADIIKKAMIDVYNFLMEKKLRSRIIMQVHDELVIELYAEEQNYICQDIKRIMNNIEPKIYLKTDMFIGNNWRDLSAIK